MAENENDTSAETGAPVDQGVDEIRQQLLRRIAIAGVSIVALLAGLAFFDSAVVDSIAPAPVAVSPVAPPEAAPAPTPVTPSAPPPIEPIAEPIATTPQMPATATPPPPPAVAEVPSPPERTTSPGAPPLREPRQITKPAVALPASIKPTSPSPAPASVKPAEALAKASKNPPAPAKPLTQQAVQSDSGRRYLVQMGVFNTVANAEDLLGKLQKAGIPAQIEARVQVGPFASKAEAEAAQKKLTELGLSTGMLMSAKK